MIMKLRMLTFHRQGLFHLSFNRLYNRDQLNRHFSVTSKTSRIFQKISKRNSIYWILAHQRRSLSSHRRCQSIQNSAKQRSPVSTCWVDSIAIFKIHSLILLVVRWTCQQNLFAGWPTETIWMTFSVQFHRLQFHLFHRVNQPVTSTDWIWISKVLIRTQNQQRQIRSQISQVHLIQNGNPHRGRVLINWINQKTHLHHAIIPRLRRTPSRVQLSRRDLTTVDHISKRKVSQFRRRKLTISLETFSAHRDILSVAKKVKVHDPSMKWGKLNKLRRWTLKSSKSWNGWVELRMNCKHEFLTFYLHQTEGKTGNIRALLCSVHTILWPDAKWSKCEMSQLISANEVKKAYRKCCLAVHPDKVRVLTEFLVVFKYWVFISQTACWKEPREFGKADLHGTKQRIFRIRERRNQTKSVLKLDRKERKKLKFRLYFLRICCFKLWYIFIEQPSSYEQNYSNLWFVLVLLMK